MLHKDSAELESILLHELIEGCIEAEGYEIVHRVGRTYRIKTKQGNTLTVYLSVKGA